MKKAAVIGSPISHSLSPRIFSFLAKRRKQSDFSYDAIEVKPESLKGFLERARSELIGFNVTLPNKIEILPFLDELSPEAKAVGAVNVVANRQGKFHGFNTDVYGIEKTLEEQGYLPSGQQASIYGAGGAARAVAYALGRAGAASVYILNRDLQKAEKLVDDFQRLFPKTHFLSSAPKNGSLVKVSLFVNATSLGMSGGTPAGDFFNSLGVIPHETSALAFDLIYTPQNTPFLAAAKALGFRTVGGISMLAHQALGSYRHFLGDEVSSEDGNLLQCALSLHLSKKPIFFTGFMGSGKTTTGKLLADLLSYPFLDLDQLLEKSEGKSVTEIFNTRGESYFRDLEKKFILECTEKASTVIALGGGSLLNPLNQSVILRSGILIHLSAPIGEIEERLRDSVNRPLIDLLPTEERRLKLNELFSKRSALYESAPIQVNTTRRSPERVVQNVLTAVFKHLSQDQIGNDLLNHVEAEK